MLIAAVPAAVVLSVGQAAEPAAAADLDDPAKKEIAMQIVSTAENSSLQWREQFDYIEDIGDGRGYTAGIVGFCSGTHDMLELVEYYTDQEPDNPLAEYLPALREVDGSDSHEGLDPGYPDAWVEAAATQEFQDAQEHERDRVYFNPSLSQAKADGLRALGQFAYYDAIVMHGESGFQSIRADAMSQADTPAEGGDETEYLHAFLDARVAEMKTEEAHEDTSRVDTAQRVFLNEGNLDLNTPLTWAVYGEEFHIEGDPAPDPDPTDPPGDATLISRDKPATSSSNETSSLTPDQAVDGDPATRWASAEGVDPQWISVDLGAGSTVSAVNLTWEAAYAEAYRVEISADGSNWTALATETAGDGGTDQWANLTGEGRHLRVYGTARGTEWGYSLFEVGVYGTTGQTPDPTDPPTDADFTVVAAGDIATNDCTADDSGCRHAATADRAMAINPDFYLTMGDNQYDSGTIDEFTTHYDTTWGRFKDKTRPAPGNHESYDPSGSEAGYKEYFGAIAYPDGESWYSYDEGNWHFVALNSNRFDEQEQLDWLAADLAANSKKCVAAYFHHPLFSSGDHGNDPVGQTAWEILYEANADLVLSGHDHHYERFSPQNPQGEADPNGIIEIIGGVGGDWAYPIVDIQPNSEKRVTDKYGVLKLDFTADGFSSQFVETDGTVLDTSPSYSCH